MLIVIVALGGHLHGVLLLEAAPAHKVSMDLGRRVHVHGLRLRGQVLKQEVLHGLPHVLVRLEQFGFEGRICEHVFLGEVGRKVLGHAGLEAIAAVREELGRDGWRLLPALFLVGLADVVIGAEAAVVAQIVMVLVLIHSVGEVVFIVAVDHEFLHVVVLNERGCLFGVRALGRRQHGAALLAVLQPRRHRENLLGLRGGLQLGRVRKGLNCCLQLEVRREYLLLQLLGGEERVLQELVLQLLLAIVGQPVVGA